jgi:site-specific recombinase XerC
MKTIQDLAVWHGGKGRRPFVNLDIRAQIQILIDELGPLHIHRHKRVAYRTIKARAYVVQAFLTTIREQGFHVKSIMNLDQRHISAAVAVWVKNGLAAPTIQTRMSILRWLTKSIGKRGMVFEAAYYGVDATMTERSYVATIDKSWSAHSVISTEIVEKAKALDRWVGMQADLMRVFGLRVLEAIQMIPLESDQGSTLKVEEGTKGGRTRTVEMRTDEQRTVLEAAKRLAAESPQKTMCQPRRSLSQSIRRFYYVMSEKLGISKAALGVTPHGLRHEYANDLYEKQTGRKSPVRGGGEILDRAADALARSKVTADLGHKRLGITSAYVGGMAKGPRGRKGGVAAVDQLATESEPPTAEIAQP